MEDYLRADTYGLIASLLASPPDRSFLNLYSPPRSDPQEQGGFTLQQPEPTAHEAALRELQLACEAHDESTVASEYDELFVQSGSAATRTATPSQAQLATLRNYLAGMGLSAVQSDSDTTRHIAAACEVMRWMLQNDKPVELQNQFFLEFVDAGVTAICDAIEENPSARFYRAVSTLAKTFLVNEHARFAAYTPPKEADPRG